MEKPKFDGVPVYMDGRQWIVPALSVRQFREHLQTLSTPYAAGEDYAAFLQDRLPIALAAMQRNYPELTEEQLLDMLDLKTFLVVWRAIQNASGLRPAEPGESQPVADASTGVGSTGR
jgi:hypothetical protein